MSATIPGDLAKCDTKDFGDSNTRENESSRETNDNGTAESQAAKSTDDDEIIVQGDEYSGTKLPKRDNSQSDFLLQSDNCIPSEIQKRPKLTHNTREQDSDAFSTGAANVEELRNTNETDESTHLDIVCLRSHLDDRVPSEIQKRPKLTHYSPEQDYNGNATRAENVGLQNTNETDDSTDEEIVWLGSQTIVPEPDDDIGPVANVEKSLRGLTKLQNREKKQEYIMQMLERFNSPVGELAYKGNSTEDAIELSDESTGILSVHTHTDVDAQVNPDFDDVSVILLSTSDEEDFDDDAGMIPFKGDKSFMGTKKQANLRDEPVVEAPELPVGSTQKRFSIRETAESFKKEHGFKDDESILAVEKAVRKVRSKRNWAFGAKAKLLRDYQRKKRGPVAEAQEEDIQQFPTRSYEESCHIRGEYLDGPMPKDGVTVVMIEESIKYSDKGGAELLDLCYGDERMGYIGYKNEMQQHREIPKYIIERRIKEAEEVVDLVCQELETSHLREKVKDYLKILLNLSSKKTINRILTQQSKKMSTANIDEEDEAGSDGKKSLHEGEESDGTVSDGQMIEDGKDFAGCQCKSKCKTPRCPCFRAGLECTPGLCKTCQACTDPVGIPEIRKQFCRNDNIRMRRQNRGLMYKKSTIPEAGWGLFCKTEIKQGEYIGEVISEAEVGKRKEAGENLDYLFDLGKGHCVDGLRIGNITRYMNHSDQKPNVRVAIVKVDGFPHIAFFACAKIIPAGVELFFDYGRRYKYDFAKGPKGCTSESGKKSENPIPSAVDPKCC